MDEIRDRDKRGRFVGKGKRKTAKKQRVISENDHEYALSGSFREEEMMDLDCETVFDDREMDKQPYDALDHAGDQDVEQAHTETADRERKIKYNMLEETSFNQEVDFQSIHGLPVDVPFTLQYLSPCAGKTLKSKMYIIVEQKILSYTPVTSVNISVQGDICEHMSGDNICPFLKDIEEEKISSWVDIQNVVSQFAMNRDNCDLSNEPVVVKQEVEEEPTVEHMNTARDTVMLDRSTNDAVIAEDFVVGGNVTVFPDGLSSNCHELCEVQMNNGQNGDSFSQCKSNGISNKGCDKKRKFVEVQETPSICQSEQQRLRSRNSSIDYRKFGDGTPSGKKLGKKQTGKEEDPDFDPYEIEPKYKQPASHSESADDGNEEENLDLNMDEHSEQIGAESCRTSEEVSLKARRMFNKKKMLKKMEQEKSRIRVKLSEHADKYTIQDYVSFLMSDRGKEHSEKTTKMLVCTQCKKFRTENEEQMEEHIEQHVNGELSCKECNFHASYLQEMRIHNRKHRNVRIQMRRCPVCHLRFKDDKCYRDHLSSIHNLSQEVCKVCLKAGIQVSFSNSSKLQDHFLEQHKDLMHKCNDCERYFRTKTSLTTHSCLAETNNTLNAPCEICGMVMRKHSIPDHKKRVHFQIRMHPCPDCNFAAKDPWRLKKHIEARHKGIRSLHCDQCTFSCVYPYQLVSHQRTHTGVKPYKCDECPYTAAWNVQLKDHKKLHSNPLGVECPICGVVVKRGTSYTIHMKKEHSDTCVDY